MTFNIYNFSVHVKKKMNEYILYTLIFKSQKLKIV